MDKGFEDKKDIEKYEELIRNIGMQLERAKIGNYVDLMQNPTRIIILNFLGGISRGFGIAIGFTILGAIVLYSLQRLVMLNLPIIGGFVSEVVKLVQSSIR
ncbi:DUF5665 domain-containing protein [Caloramator sp. E03]|uniref:DUF5665 domain-containing protein n=1 Tax=Caloramator sp. E03 TaxID=2576307 RepID=UPI001FAAE4B4|nr:DUF5665 domain-containing protein [Caloramator sp. E03]